MKIKGQKAVKLLEKRLKKIAQIDAKTGQPYTYFDLKYYPEIRNDLDINLSQEKAKELYKQFYFEFMEVING